MKLLKGRKNHQACDDHAFMTVVVGAFKPSVLCHNEGPKKQESAVPPSAEMIEGRGKLVSPKANFCPWTQRSLTRLNKKRNSFKEVVEFRQTMSKLDHEYLLALEEPSSPTTTTTKPKHGFLHSPISTIKRLRIKRDLE